MFYEGFLIGLGLFVAVLLICLLPGAFFGTLNIVSKLPKKDYGKAEDLRRKQLGY